jgi:hypothetical protein
MFKAACLICKKPDGTLASVIGESLDPLLAQAKKANTTGLLDGVPVDSGVVMANWRRDVAFQFNVATAVKEACQPEPKKRKAKNA